jgi:hypothetical protein
MAPVARRIRIPRFRKRPLLILEAVFCTGLVALASFFSYVLSYYCIDDTTSRESAFCQEGGAAHLVIPLVLVLVGAPVVTAIVSAIGVRTSRCWPALLATLICVPLTAYVPGALEGYSPPQPKAPLAVPGN